MKLLIHLIKNLLLFELCAGENDNKLRVWAVSHKGGDLALIEKPFRIGDNTEKWKHFPAILLISGKGVITKNFKKEDASIKKIIENPELLWSLHTDSSEHVISFVRRELAAGLIESIEKSNIYVLEKWVVPDDNPDKEKLIAGYYENQLKPSVIRRNLTLINQLSLVIYYKIRLPVLVFLFVILLGNFLFNTRIRQEYETAQSELYIKQRNNKLQQDNQRKQGRIQSLYQSIPERSLALIADRIASYVPPTITLSSLIFSPLEGIESNLALRNKELKFKSKTVLLKGDVEIPGSVTLFTQFLSNDLLFSDVKMQSLIREKDSSHFTFELKVELKQ